MSEDHSYRETAWWTSGRTGLAKSDSAPNAIHFTAPTEFGGLEGRWTPEELLLAAVAGCYTTTLRAIAGTAQFDFTDLLKRAEKLCLVSRALGTNLKFEPQVEIVKPASMN